MLSSTIPTEIGYLTNLLTLDFGSNKLFGTIPKEIGRMSALAGLSFFDNNLTGAIPVELENLDGLQVLYLDSNNLEGPVSDGICDLSLSEFWSDCSEVECICCTKCCVDGGGCT